MLVTLYRCLKKWSLPLFVLVFLVVSIGFLIQSPSSVSAARFEHADKIAHFVLFFILAATMHLAFAPRVWLGLMLLFGYGLVIEWIQYHIPGRGAELMDLIADMLGAVSFYLLLFFLRYFFRLRLRRL